MNHEIQRQNSIMGKSTRFLLINLSLFIGKTHLVGFLFGFGVFCFFWFFGGERKNKKGTKHIVRIQE